MTDITQMDADDYNSTLRLMGDLRSLVAAEYLSAETRLSSIDHALMLAIGGPPEQARDFVLEVVFQQADDGDEGDAQ